MSGRHFRLVVDGGSRNLLEQAWDQGTRPDANEGYSSPRKTLLAPATLDLTAEEDQVSAWYPLRLSSLKAQSGMLAKWQ